MAISTNIHPPSFFYISLFLLSSQEKALILKMPSAICYFEPNDGFLVSNFTSLFFPPSLSLFFFLYCSTHCRSFIRSLSRLKGLAGPFKKHTHSYSHACRARWVTAALRPRGKSLWRDARLSYALNLHSDRLQDTERKRGTWRAQEHPRLSNIWLCFYDFIQKPLSIALLHLSIMSSHPHILLLEALNILSSIPFSSDPRLLTVCEWQIQFSPWMDLDCKSFACSV